MTQPPTERAAINWADAPQLWIGLALSFVAISMPQWIAALTDGKNLAFVAAGGFTVAALASAVRAARLNRARQG